LAVTVTTVKNKVKRVRWENYLREFENAQNDVEEFYWNCVVSDLLNIRDHSFQTSEVQLFSQRFYTSYIGSFYKTHEIYHKLLQQFEGLGRLYRDDGKKEWESWKNLLIRKKHDSLKTLVHLVTSNYDSLGSIKTTGTTSEYPVYNFDSYHAYLAQKISSAVIPHVQNGLLPHPVRGTYNAAFQFVISSDLRSTLHEQGGIFASRLMMLRVIRQVDKHFKKNNSPIKAYPEMPPSDAIDDLLMKYPEYKSLSVSQLTYLLQVKYRDQQGQELKNDSLRKTLQRRGY